MRLSSCITKGKPLCSRCYYSSIQLYDTHAQRVRPMCDHDPLHVMDRPYPNNIRIPPGSRRDSLSCPTHARVSLSIVCSRPRKPSAASRFDLPHCPRVPSSRIVRRRASRAGARSGAPTRSPQPR